MKTVVTQLKDHGTVTRGWIGVQIQPVTAEIADSLGLKKAEGALVAEPQANGPAAKAGIKAGDVITAVNGKPVKDARELASISARWRPATRSKSRVAARARTSINLTLGELPNTSEAKADPQGKAARQGSDVPQARPDLVGQQRCRGRQGASWSPTSIRRARPPSAASRQAT